MPCSCFTQRASSRKICKKNKNKKDNKKKIYNIKRIDDNIVLTSKYFKGVIKDNYQIYKKGGKSQKLSKILIILKRESDPKVNLNY
jgi:hypothetical protein